MRKVNLFAILFCFLLFLLACSDGGTVDPNALAGHFEYSSDEMSTAPLSSASEANIDNDNYLKHESSSSSKVREQSSFSGNEKNGYDAESSTSVMPTTTNSSSSVETNITGDSASISYKITFNHDSVEINSPKKGFEMLVFEQENGAVTSCHNDTQMYEARFKMEASNMIAQSLTLNNYGEQCNPYFDVFKALCSSGNQGESVSFAGSCDEYGNLNAYCTYIDTNASYQSVLGEFTNKTKMDCDYIVVQ